MDGLIRRIDGDEFVAAQIEAVRRILKEALDELWDREAPLADRAIKASGLLVRAEMVHAAMTSGLERITQVPWVAIALDPSVCRPTMDHAGRSAAYASHHDKQED